VDLPEKTNANQMPNKGNQRITNVKQSLCRWILSENYSVSYTTLVV
jgi:hypothetical protein